jgi:GNAT superfamily N-acetyltransferase
MPADPARPTPPPPLSGFVPLEVWLEPEWDDGRVGAWVPDLPGTFAHATSRDRAVTAALSATGRVREWLERNGESVLLPPIWRPEVAGEVPCTRDGEYRVQALLPSDERRATPETVEDTVRRLGWARADLLAMLARLDGHEAAHGRLPVDLEAGERSVAEIVRHLAVAEAWLVGRLPGAGRYPGSLEDPAERHLLEATRAWVADRLPAIVIDDSAAVTVDRHGERWTLAKVLRRLQAHALDHLWELETRLMRADHTVERLELGLGRVPGPQELRGLLRAVGWDVRASQADLMAEGFARTAEVATAWDGEQLVATGRSMGDGRTNALITTVLVHPRYQRLGLGERIMHCLIDDRPGVKFVLEAAPGMEAWYGSMGFLPDRHSMFLPRRRS